MTGRFPWTALAIVVAGAFIGVGLYVRPAAAPPPKDESAARTRAVAEAVAFVEAQRADMIRACWEPSVAKAAEPARIHLTFGLTFDKDGKEIGRGINEYRDAFRADVAQCLRAMNKPAQISPPGVTVAVDVDLFLPN